MPLDRRKFIGASALGGSAMLLPAASAAAAAEPGAAPKDPGDVTRVLARYIVNARFESLPRPVIREATRTLLNWTGCAAGGSRSEAVEFAISALSPFFGPAQASLPGRRERPDILHASLLSGIASHVLDFDDTHLPTIIHPAGPVVSAILALSEYRPVSGADFVNALVLGVETECRIGNAVYPEHYDRGWHITGTAGVFGAAAACGKLLALDERQMTWALGLAATQPVGLREMFGTMNKSFHPGRAAQNGLTAALLASKNFDSSEKGIEAKSGWAHVLSTKCDYERITGGLGQSWEISLNSYKPFACGIVLHPAIDACLQLRREHPLGPGDVQSIQLDIHPLVLELTGKQTPRTGLEGKFSVYHAAAVSFVEGAAGEKQFSDAAVRDPRTVALRGLVTCKVDPAVKEDQVRATVTLRDARSFVKFIEHAIGSASNPMPDAELEAKFLALVEGILPAGRARQAMDLCWNMQSQKAASTLARAAAL